MAMQESSTLTRDTLFAQDQRVAAITDKLTIPSGAGSLVRGTVLDVDGQKCDGTSNANASGSIVFAANPSADDTISVAGTTYTFKASASDENDIAIGANLSATITNIIAETFPTSVSVTAKGTTGITVTAVDTGVAGNNIALASSAGNGTVTAMSGGAGEVYAILAEDVDASSESKNAPIYLTGEFNSAALNCGSNTTIDALKNAARKIGLFFKNIG